MNQKRTEIACISKLEDALIKLGYVTPDFQKNDKTPSWDGFVFLYNEKDSDSKKDLERRIPVQIKGHYAINFKVIKKYELLPEFLFALLNRNLFNAYSRFNSWGSARETFDWSEMCRVQIPLPPIQIQQKIVDLYNCYEECKCIANEAREKISNLCPALVQKAAHSR